ncbi:hypothetical protein [Rhodococcus sp. ACT016]|uniref:hypothetical protein n=1 Tax=Rhodococcus sp. ACT016 TaxID=3134808 RepID=UPI003D2CAD6B
MGPADGAAQRRTVSGEDPDLHEIRTDAPSHRTHLTGTEIGASSISLSDTEAMARP